MNCISLQGVERVALTQKEDPVRKPGEALLAIKAVSICGSDIKAYKGHGTPVAYPLVVGHEAVAEILEIDAGNRAHLKAGDLAAVDPYIYCGTCYACSLERTNCCESMNCIGVHSDGCMSELYTHPESLLPPVPKEVPLHLAPLAEPLTIALHALHRTSLAAGEHIAIFGAGAIGLLAALAALHYQAVPILIDVLDERLAYAASLGIPYTCDAKNGTVAEQIREITNGRMAEVVMEATGVESCIRETANAASYCGRVALTGWPTRAPVFDTFSVTKKELNVYGCRNSKGEFAEAFALIAGKRVDVSKVVSKVVPFAELPQAVRDLADRPADFLKIVGTL
jgi:threonine dehydrogenase-like Zn-dependent dehydrogenase